MTGRALGFCAGNEGAGFYAGRGRGWNRGPWRGRCWSSGPELTREERAQILDEEIRIAEERLVALKGRRSNATGEDE